MIFLFWQLKSGAIFSFLWITLAQTKLIGTDCGIGKNLWNTLLPESTMVQTHPMPSNNPSFYTLLASFRLAKLHQGFQRQSWTILKSLKLSISLYLWHNYLNSIRTMLNDFSMSQGRECPNVHGFETQLTVNNEVAVVKRKREMVSSSGKPKECLIKLFTRWLPHCSPDSQ